MEHTRLVRGGWVDVETGLEIKTYLNAPRHCGQVAHIFDGTAVRLVAMAPTRLDPTETYARQPHAAPPRAWLSLWRKE